MLLPQSSTLQARSQYVSLRCVGACDDFAVQSPDTGYGTVDHPSQFGGKVRRAVLLQTTLCLLGRKPRGTPIRLLRWLEPRDLAKMGLHGEFFLGRFPGGSHAVPRISAFATNILGKRSFLHPAVNSGL